MKDLFKRKEEGPVRLTGLITQSTPLENENDLRNFIKNKKQILKKESLDKCKELEKSAQFYKTVQALHSSKDAYSVKMSAEDSYTLRLNEG